MEKKIDLKNELAIRASLARSAARGADPIRALDELGFLLYPNKRRQLQAETLLQAADLLDQLTVKHLPASKAPLTPLDTKRVTAQWLRLMAQEMGKGHEK